MQYDYSRNIPLKMEECLTYIVLDVHLFKLFRPQRPEKIGFYFKKILVLQRLTMLPLKIIMEIKKKYFSLFLLIYFNITNIIQTYSEWFRRRKITANQLLVEFFLNSCVTVLVFFPFFLNILPSQRFSVPLSGESMIAAGDRNEPVF